MPQFILKDAHGVAWDGLDQFTQGYLEALFFTSDEELGELGFADFDPETLSGIATDCAKFQSDNAALLAEAYARDYDEAQAGRDYWFTRCGHGVGYWDRDELGDALGGALSDSARRCGELWASRGDDGRIYL